MKYFLIKYKFKNGNPADWHKKVAAFIANVEKDPALKGKMSYRCMKERDGNQYYHLAGVTDDGVIEALQSRDFFKAYNEATEHTAEGGEVEVSPLEMFAETALR